MQVQHIKFPYNYNVLVSVQLNMSKILIANAALH